MVDPADFTAAIRHGARAGDPLVVVHVRADEERNSRLVVRASSKALGVPSKELGAHLDRVMERAWRKWDAR